VIGWRTHQEWFLNTPVLWLAALVLISLLRGPLRSAPALLKKPLKFAAAKVRREDGMYVPILRVTTPSKPTVKGLAEVLLEGMGAVDATRGTENERTRRVKYLMRNTGTEVPGP